MYRLVIIDFRMIIILIQVGLASCDSCILKNDTQSCGNLIFSLVLQNADDQWKKGKRKVQEVPQSQTAALPRPQEEEETDKSKQAQTEQTYEKH